MTDISAVPPLSSGASGASAPAPAAASAPAAPAAEGSTQPKAAGSASTSRSSSSTSLSSSSSSPTFGGQLVRALELGLVTALGAFSASPVATAGTITWRNYAAAGVAAGFSGLWSVARALGYQSGATAN